LLLIHLSLYIKTYIPTDS